MERSRSHFALRVALGWLPLASLCLIAGLFAYSVIPQLREPVAQEAQLTLAYSARAALERGVVPEAAVPEAVVRIGESRAAYVGVYDGLGAPLAGSGTLHGTLPKPPPEVFTEALRLGEYAVTWQPEPGIREALVVMPYGDGPAGYVVAGRSLSEVERREHVFTVMAGGALALSLVATLLFVALRERYSPR